MTAAPTVVVSQGAVDACGYTEPATKEVVELVPGGRGGVDLGPPAIDPRWSDVEVDGEPARRGVARLPDGRTEAVLRLTRLNTAVSVRVRDPRLAEAVLDSTRVVRDLDSNGCAVTRSRTPLATRAAAPVDLGEPDWIGVCYYERERRQEQDRLGLSHRQAGRALDALLSALRRAPAGANPDVPENCLDDALSTLALVLVLHTDGEPDRHLIVYFEGCVGRGIQHDSGVATVTQRVLKAAFAGTSFGWSWSDGVPAG
jgi:hypothetical protein